MATFHAAATDEQGRLTAPSVLAQIDARTKATMRADLPALAEELEIGGVDGSVPIFPTLAEAQAWEAKNPGKTALTLEPSTPDTKAPTPGVLSVTPAHNSALMNVSGATDDRGVSEYSFQVGSSGAWSAWQKSASYTATGLALSTAYSFRHKVRDAAGNESLGTPVNATTAAAPAHPYVSAAQGMNLEHIYALDGSAVKNAGTATTPAPRLTGAVTYGTGVGGFAQSMTGGTLWLDGIPTANTPAYTVAIVTKSLPDLATFKNMFRDWNDKNRLQIASTAGANVGGPTTSGILGTWKPSTSTLYHIAMTWDGTTVSVYVDGTLIGTRADAGPVAAATTYYFEAAFHAGLSGVVVDMKKALTAAQIKALSDAVAR